MNIVFSNYDSPGNPWYDGGGARAIQAVARRLAGRHQVRVVCGRFPGGGDTLIEGVPYVRIGASRAGPKLGQLLFQLALPGQARRSDFDVWVESLTPPFSTACLQRFTRRPVVALTQVLAGRGMGAKYHLPFATLERWGLRTYRRAIATSAYLEQELLAIHPKLETCVIPNGVEGEWVRDSTVRDERHILFMGRIDVAQKGVDLLLDALAAAPGINVPLVLAGAGVPRDEAWVRQRIRQLGLEGRIQLVGRVEGATRQRLFREAYALALPSRFEASPLVIAEAFCFGVPVVHFDIPELVGYPADACQSVAAFDVRAYGRALSQLVIDGAKRTAMSGAAKASARHYDWDHLAQQYEDFLTTRAGRFMAEHGP